MPFLMKLDDAIPLFCKSPRVNKGGTRIVGAGRDACVPVVSPLLTRGLLHFAFAFLYVISLQ
ncbi:MAG: hypothetical protein ACRD6X_09495 [Pyrinomonadaceae bacterium]